MLYVVCYNANVTVLHVETSEKLTAKHYLLGIILHYCATPAPSTVNLICDLILVIAMVSSKFMLVLVLTMQ